MKKIIVLITAVTVSMLLYNGCSTRAKYEYIKQQDSACVEGAITPVQNSDNGSCYIEISQIDGLVANYDASRPGANWSFTVPKHPLYLTPRKHAIALVISEIDTVNAPGAAGVVGAYGSGSKPTISAEFMANHVYRFAADLYGNSIDLTLWDETSGPATRSRVDHWILDSNRAYNGVP